MLYYERGGESEVLTDDDMRDGLYEALGKIGSRTKVLAVPPDITRFHSKAGPTFLILAGARFINDCVLGCL